MSDEVQRIKKVANLVAKLSISAERIPAKIPDYIRSAIESIRGTYAEIILSESEKVSEVHRNMQSVLAEVSNLNSVLQEKNVQITKSEGKVASLQGDLSAQKEKSRGLNQTIGNLQKENIILKNENKRLIDQLNALQNALGNIESTQQVEENYKINALQRTVTGLKESQDELQRALESKQMEENKLKSKLRVAESKIDDLSAEVHTLSSHIQNKLTSIAESQDINRMLMANWVVQLLQGGEAQKDIVKIMTSTLGFTTEQQRIVEDAISPKASPNEPQGLSDQWLSFLLKEANTAGSEPFDI